jgi:hypothetical protein
VASPITAEGRPCRVAVASLARVVAASDEARTRIEPHLHDGTPQLGELGSALSGVVRVLAAIFDELRAISQGIRPAVLSEGGLDAALRALRRRSAVPVDLDLHTGTPAVRASRGRAVLHGVRSHDARGEVRHATVVHIELDTQARSRNSRSAIRVGRPHPSEGAPDCSGSAIASKAWRHVPGRQPRRQQHHATDRVQLEDQTHWLSPAQ